MKVDPIEGFSMDSLSMADRKHALLIYRSSSKNIIGASARERNHSHRKLRIPETSASVTVAIQHLCNNRFQNQNFGKHKYAHYFRNFTYGWHRSALPEMGTSPQDLHFPFSNASPSRVTEFF